MLNEILIVIISSAAVASLISGLFFLINEHLRRKSEEKQLKMRIALKLTKMKDEQVEGVVNRAKGQVEATWVDPSDNLKEYLKRVKDMWKKI